MTVTTIKLPLALQIYLSFCEKVYVVAFFKVLQQQTISKVGNFIIVCLRIISVCNSEIIFKIGQYLRKLCSNEKGSNLYDSQCS